MNPCFSALTNLRLVNGFNSLNQKSHLQDQLTPIPPKGASLFSRAFENYNFTLLIILVPCFVSLIAFICRTIISKKILKGK